jgi:hypothetical protein
VFTGIKTCEEGFKGLPMSVLPSLSSTISLLSSSSRRDAVPGRYNEEEDIGNNRDTRSREGHKIAKIGLVQYLKEKILLFCGRQRESCSLDVYFVRFGHFPVCRLDRKKILKNIEED